MTCSSVYINTNMTFSNVGVCFILGVGAVKAAEAVNHAR